ncbi:divalent cation transporter, putative [Trypanosoma equiperdum]|uniref:Divalent cation transporter, putative n=1 Tax=Trypanosoma equiperdum TaxID=5694 RepID=A0A1G4I8M3_TRYEQ|nr:divalent cation transporter, putative [Trypanosoma equiperdum]
MTVSEFGRSRVLYRRNGVSDVIEVGNTTELNDVIALLRSFSGVPKSYTTLVTPSLAELCEDAVGVERLWTSSAERTELKDFAWLEVETESDEVMRQVLSAFPIHSKTSELVRSSENRVEVVEIFPSCGYVWVSIAAKGAASESSVPEDDEPVVVSLIAYEQFLITMHRKPLSGFEDMKAHMEMLVKSPASYGAPVPTAVCSLISGFVKEYQKELLSLLVDVDNVNELVLEIQPSECDQLDLLRRIDDLRHSLSRVQASYFAKERVLQRLLLPVVKRTFISSAVGVAARYQRMLSGLILSIERLRKGRDVLNMSSMGLVSGVSMRLLQRCYWMDYLNNVMTMMTLVSMPISIIPGLFTMNVRVPFEDSESFVPFYVIVAVTAGIFFLGMSYPVYLYLTFKSPGALVPTSH